MKVLVKWIVSTVWIPFYESSDVNLKRNPGDEDHMKIEEAKRFEACGMLRIMPGRRANVITCLDSIRIKAIS